MPRRPDPNRKPTHNTTINVPYEQWLELKLKAIDRKMYMSEIINEIIEDYLKSIQK